MSQIHACALKSKLTFRDVLLEVASALLVRLAELIVSTPTYADGWEQNTGASNLNSIANMRHNLTQSYMLGRAGIMNIARNDFAEVCIYWHTHIVSKGDRGHALQLTYSWTTEIYSIRDIGRLSINFPTTGSRHLDLFKKRPLSSYSYRSSNLSNSRR